MEGFLIFLAFGLIVLGLILWGWASQRENAKAWQRTADELGLSYYASYDDLLGRLGTMATFRRGRRQHIRNAVVGADGDTEVTVAEFIYVTGSGKSSHRHTETVCVLQSAALSLPNCFLRPENWVFDYLGKLFGGQDIDFAEDTEFSRAYVLQGRSPMAVRELFDASTRGWFLEQRARKLHFEAQDNTFVFHTGRRLGAEHAGELMAQALQIRGLLSAASVGGSPASP